MEVALNQDIMEIYHVDTADLANRDFVSDEGISSTPTTYIIKDGVIVETFVGHRTVVFLETVIIDYLS
jgi:hypothetical protein